MVIVQLKRGHRTTNQVQETEKKIRGICIIYYTIYIYVHISIYILYYILRIKCFVLYDIVEKIKYQFR